MLQNKIYYNFLIEIFKTFFIVLLCFTLIALTARAVNFLDLIVESGYPVSIYLKYSLLNLFGIAPKFIPISFLIALIIFIVKRIQDSEFIILWTSGLKKITIINLFLFFSFLVLIIYLIFSVFLTPYALNKSRYLLSDNNFSFLPTIKTKQFTDSFKGFSFFVEKKSNEELESIFIHDKGNNLKNLSSNTSKVLENVIVAEKGIVNNKRMILFKGQIVSSKNNNENEIILFEQLNIDLGNLSTTTIKKPKIQETSTVQLLNCLINRDTTSYACNENFIKETVPVLNRRLVTPFYIPVLSLICSLLLIKSKKIFYNRIFVFSYGFFILIFTEITVRYTGLNNFAATSYLLSPLLLIILIYSILIFNLSTENKTNE